MPATDPTPDVRASAAALRTARLLWAALAVSPLALGAIAVLRPPQRGAGAQPLFGEYAIYGWLGLVVACVGGWLFLWRSIVTAPDEPRARRRARDGSLRVADVMTRAIIAWALIEGASLTGVVAYFLMGGVLLLAASLLLQIVAFAVSFPRAAWFEIFVAAEPRQPVPR